MENLLSQLTIMSMVVAAFSTWQWRMWRKTALSQRATQQEPAERETQYQESYQAKLNALEDERRDQLETMTEVFDFLNDQSPFGSHQEGLMQCRNKLLTSIQTNTFGRV